MADNPLAILDWSSVSLSDLYRIPSGLPMTPGEPPQRITFNPDHRWVYVPEMAPEEVLFFKQGDTRVGTVRAARRYSLSQLVSWLHARHTTALLCPAARHTLMLLPP